MKNPNWIFDELILALDVYISNGRQVPGDNAPAVNELSVLLNKFWQKVYGERGDGFIECHHISPLCELAGSTKTSLQMLRLVTDGMAPPDKSG